MTSLRVSKYADTLGYSGKVYKSEGPQLRGWAGEKVRALQRRAAMLAKSRQIRKQGRLVGMGVAKVGGYAAFGVTHKASLADIDK